MPYELGEPSRIAYFKKLSCRQTLETNTTRFHHHSELSIE
jgi:hypothetical protein